MSTMNLFKALGDPIRFKMVQRLSGGQEYTLTSLSKGLLISRQGARKHIRVLEEAQVIKLYQQGRDMYVQLDTHSLFLMKKFLTQLEHQWEVRLNALRTIVENK